MSFYTKLAAYITYLMEDRSHSLADQPVLALLKGLSAVYRYGVVRRFTAYARHPERQAHLAAKVISLGNITAGGTGKTPTACMLAQWLQRQGYRVALLNRGYRSAAEHGAAIMSDGKDVLLSAQEGGDEALLLARSLPGIPVLVGRERAQTGQLAIDRFHSQVLLLDDAFQHWQLARDLDIVLIDATNPFGNGALLPRGILREPVSHLSRAGFFIITKADQRTEADKQAIYAVLTRYNSTAPVAEAVHRPAWCVSFAAWYEAKADRHTCEQLPHQAVIAVSALGNPASFEATVTACGYTRAGNLRFDDHHQYTNDDLSVMIQMAAEKKAVLVTTEKDAVKLPASFILQHDVPLWVLGIEIVIEKGKEELQNVILQHIGG